MRPLGQQRTQPQTNQLRHSAPMQCPGVAKHTRIFCEVGGVWRRQIKCVPFSKTGALFIGGALSLYWLMEWWLSSKWPLNRRECLQHRFNCKNPWLCWQRKKEEIALLNSAKHCQRVNRYYFLNLSLPNYSTRGHPFICVQLNEKCWLKHRIWWHRLCICALALGVFISHPQMKNKCTNNRSLKE